MLARENSGNLTYHKNATHNYADHINDTSYILVFRITAIPGGSIVVPFWDYLLGSKV